MNRYQFQEFQYAMNRHQFQEDYFSLVDAPYSYSIADDEVIVIGRLGHTMTDGTMPSWEDFIDNQSDGGTPSWEDWEELLRRFILMINGDEY